MGLNLLALVLLCLTSRLAIAGRPSPPKNFRITESTLTRVSLAWERPDSEGDYPLEGYIISMQYSCPQDPWGCMAPELDLHPDQLSCVLKIPSDTTKYKITAIAYNKAQISPWSRLRAQSEIRTPAPTTKPPPTTAPASEPTTAQPTTSEPTTPQPSTSEPTTAQPTTIATEQPTVLMKEEAKTTEKKDTEAPTQLSTTAPLNVIELTTAKPTIPITPETCDHPLGIESEFLEDGNFAASSFHKDGGHPYNARLHNHKYAWVPRDDDPTPWWQVLLKKVSIVTGMAIQGHPQQDYWITKLSVRHSVDGVSWYRLGQFEGVTDRSTVKRFEFETPLSTRYIEIFADEVNGKAALRMELYGCDHEMPTCGRVPAETKRRYKRVIGGVESTPHSWPWVGIMKHEGQPYCAATLLSETWAVTAAHCFSEGEDRASAQGWTVTFGKHRVNEEDSGEHTRTIVEIRKHPEHDSEFDIPGHALEYDIAMFRLDSKLELGQKINPICRMYSAVDFGPGDECIQVGWGNTAPSLRADILRQVGYNLVEGSECEDSLSQDFICAGSKDGGKSACEGDGGNGVFCPHRGYYYLVGIVSETKGCSAERKYEKLVNVKEMMPFIRETIQGSWKEDESGEGGE